MQIYLMQHGLALSKQEDPERPLSADGIDQVRRTAAGLRQLLPGFDLIACSSKRRSHQTAALVAEKMRYPHSDILVSDALLPEGEPNQIFALLEREAQAGRILLVGHQPCLGRLAAALLAGAEVRFENAGLCALSRDATDRPAVLDFLLTADQLAKIGIARSGGV